MKQSSIFLYFARNSSIRKVFCHVAIFLIVRLVQPKLKVRDLLMDLVSQFPELGSLNVWLLFPYRFLVVIATAATATVLEYSPSIQTRAIVSTAIFKLPYPDYARFYSLFSFGKKVTHIVLTSK